MQITVNGENISIKQEISIKGYLLSKEIAPKTVVVEHNEIITDRNLWESTFIKNGDSLEIIHFVGGG